MGVDQLGRYLRGDAVPAIDTMTRLCRAAGISLNWLASGEGLGPEEAASGVVGDQVAVHLYEVRPSAGHGSAIWSEKPET